MDLTTELMEELDAWRPQWRQTCASVRQAADAAGVLELYQRWAATPAGHNYLQTYSGIPDHVGASRALVEAERAAFRRFQHNFTSKGDEE